jgi:hypothetical protein
MVSFLRTALLMEAKQPQVSLFELVYEHDRPDKTGGFLSWVWQAPAESDRKLFGGSENGRSEPFSLASLLGALLGTAVARKLALGSDSDLLSPTFFEALKDHHKFATKCQTALSNIISWQWFLNLSEDADHWKLKADMIAPIYFLVKCLSGESPMTVHVKNGILVEACSHWPFSYNSIR